LRDSTDVVEQLGIERTRQAIQQADFILLVLDASEGITEADRVLLQSLPNETPRIIVWNKCDLLSGHTRPVLAEERQVWVSALTCAGLESLLETMLHCTGLAEAGEATPMLTHQRHIEAIRSAREHLDQARLNLEGGMPPDIVAVDLRSAWLVLGEITGDTVDEALIDRIFRDFCIGK
ncbi:MAG: tRNA uridine-5-carboxymethylaminomethyl(34) synthesis GTPase MnmE, partial [Armatimonadota bacterium]